MSYFRTDMRGVHPALAAVGLLTVPGLGTIQPPSGDAMLVDPDVVAFYGPVFRATEVVSGSVSVGAANPETEVWARSVVLEAFKALGIDNPSLGSLQIVQAVGRMEGFYGKASKPAEWAGSNNWGAVQCCKKKGEEPCPDNTFASKDYDPNKAEAYIACFRKYPTPLAGCLDMLKIMRRTEPEKKALAAGDILAMSTAMYDAGYYQSPHKKRDEAIAYHSTAMAKNIESIRAALKEPLGTGPSPAPGKIPVPGGEKIPPGTDLTPLLFGLLPLGGLVAITALRHMVGDPLIVTPEMAREKIREVDENYKRTSTDYSKALNKKKIGLPLYREWTMLESRWLRWSEQRIGSTGDGISVASASADYDEAKRYDIERYAYVKKLESGGAAPPDRPPETEPPKVNPDGVLGGGNSLAGVFDGLKVVALLVGGFAVWSVVRK